MHLNSGGSATAGIGSARLAGVTVPGAAFTVTSLGGEVAAGVDWIDFPLTDAPVVADFITVETGGSASDSDCRVFLESF
jgi:hypothetical protein